MVQAKHHKSKPRKSASVLEERCNLCLFGFLDFPQIHEANPSIRSQFLVKKQGNHVDISEFRSQLEALGLKFIQVTADGNCFFRALADQLEGNEEEHNKYRSMVVQYIQRHREMFEPFIEDDVPFDEYCQSMEKDGTWAGHMELQAASLVTHCNICIHRLTSPRWYIQNFSNREARMIHLSYHNEEHYNSVRSKEDPCNGPAKSIVIKADADLPSTPYLTKASVTRECSESIADTGSIKMVMAGSGCENAKKVEQLLQQLNGDVDAAIEFLIAEQGTDEDLVENDELPCHSDASAGHNANGECEQSEATVDNTSKRGQSNNSIKLSHAGSNPQTNHKKIPRNKVCPCGSRKKNKACCGSGMRRSTEFVINQKVSSCKGSKERKKGRKGQSLMIATSRGSEGEPPDMGALCI